MNFVVRVLALNPLTTSFAYRSMCEVFSTIIAGVRWLFCLFGNGQTLFFLAVIRRFLDNTNNEVTDRELWQVHLSFLCKQCTDD